MSVVSTVQRRMNVSGNVFSGNDAESARVGEPTGPDPMPSLLYCDHPVLDGLSDRINPLLIKEISQQLRSKMFIGSYLFFLAIGWSMTLITLMGQQANAIDVEYGGVLFSWLYTLLLVPLCFLVPYNLHQRMRDEFCEQTVEMLTITTLSSNRIFSGKLLAGLFQASIYLFAVLPFLAFCYLLKGIGMLEIVGVLAGTSFTLLCFYYVTIMYSALGRSQIWDYFSRLTLLFFCVLLYAALRMSLLAISEGETSTLFYLVGVVIGNSPLYFCMLIFMDASHEQFKPLRLMESPYRVRVKPDGRVVFVPRLVYQEVPLEYRDDHSPSPKVVH